MLKRTTEHDENPEYINCKNRLNKIYDEKNNGIRIRSKCNWYRDSEKPSNFFLNLEKSKTAQNTIRKISKDGKNLTCHKEISKELFDFHGSLFRDKLNISMYKILSSLNLILIQLVTPKQTTNCQFLPSEEFLHALMNMSKDRMSWQRRSY